MGDTQNPSGGAQGGAGGAGPSGDSSQSSNNSNNQPRTVSWENHQRALDDMHKFKREAEEAKAKLGDQESERLKQANDFKALYEKEQKAHSETKTKLTETMNWTVNTQRFNAVKDAALATGLRKEALSDLELVDMSRVKVEATSSGRFFVEGAKEFVDGLKAERPHWFTVGNPPPVNSGGGGTPGAGAAGGQPDGSKKLTVQDVVKAEADLKARRITRAQFEETYKRYCRENPRNAQAGQLPSGRGGS